MTAFNALVCALALFAFVQVSLAALPCGIGGSGCGSVEVDVEHYCVPKSDCGRFSGGYGYGGYGYPGNGHGRGGCGCDSYCDPVTDITTCIPVFETSVQPSCGYGYGNDVYGYPGYGNGRDGCFSERICCDPVSEVTTVSCIPVFETSVQPSCGYGYGNGGYGYPGYGNGRDGCCSDRICCDPVTEVTPVSRLPVIETSVQPSCGCGYGYGGYDGNYGYPVFGRGRYSQ